MRRLLFIAPSLSATILILSSNLAFAQDSKKSRAGTAAPRQSNICVSACAKDDLFTEAQPGIAVFHFGYISKECGACLVVSQNKSDATVVKDLLAQLNFNKVK